MDPGRPVGRFSHLGMGPYFSRAYHLFDRMVVYETRGILLTNVLLGLIALALGLGIVLIRFVYIGHQPFPRIPVGGRLLFPIFLSPCKVQVRIRSYNSKCYMRRVGNEGGQGVRHNIVRSQLPS